MATQSAQALCIPSFMAWKKGDIWNQKKQFIGANTDEFTKLQKVDTRRSKQQILKSGNCSKNSLKRNER